MKKFNPPNGPEVPRSNDRFWRHFPRGFAGVTIVKNNDGTYDTWTECPNSEYEALERGERLAIYQGGHEYEVTDEEAALLVAAGFEVEDIQ